MMPCKELIKMNKKNPQIDDQVKDLLYAFNQQVRKAVESNMSQCYINVPQFFGIRGMNNDEAQLLIYGELIKQLDQLGYHVRINRKTGVWRIWGWEIITDSRIKKSLITLVASRFENDDIEN